MPVESAKGKIVPKKAKIILKNAKPVPDVKKRKRSSQLELVSDSDFGTSADQRPLMTRSRPHTLGNLVKNFSDKQKQAVVEVGFGGLLRLKLKTHCRKMLPWLVKNFNACSCMFTVASGKEFVVTRNDVCDVFCLPMGDIPVPELKKNPEVVSVDNYILQAWRSDFDVSDKQSIPLSKLESWMQELVDEREAFKRFFVVHAMSSFLAPTPNKLVSLKLLKAVEEVNEIKTFDWSSYVLRKLKKSVDKYKKDLTVQSFQEKIWCPLPLHLIKIRWCIVDCYALYMNEVACFESSVPRRFFFGVRQSNETGDNSNVVNDLHGIWEGLVSYENPECDIIDSELVAGRKYLRGQICTTLVLCDMNESRADVLADVPKFNERKKNVDYVKGIEERRKAAITEKKKQEANERKETKEKAKAEENPKEKRAEKQTKRYTPSKD
uniref:Aminotransferase-like plant mobile domain-containing protein n=1 Tax=Chenopodium quinoa TaxID=63459 RepID=A0A803MVP4_CHEQI